MCEFYDFNVVHNSKIWYNFIDIFKNYILFCYLKSKNVIYISSKDDIPAVSYYIILIIKSSIVHKTKKPITYLKFTVTNTNLFIVVCTCNCIVIYYVEQSSDKHIPRTEK